MGNDMETKLRSVIIVFTISRLAWLQFRIGNG
jgi:hypothetical protein